MITYKYHLSRNLFTNIPSNYKNKFIIYKLHKNYVQICLWNFSLYHSQFITYVEEIYENFYLVITYSVGGSIGIIIQQGIRECLLNESIGNL